MSSLLATCRRAAVVVLLLAVLPLPARDTRNKNSPTVPVDRLNLPFWKERHNKFLERARKGDVDVLFLGDSITQAWETDGKDAWVKHFEPLKAVNFGISGDRTEHVLWRITEGKELDGLHPKVAVLMIGTNNTGSCSADQIADGIVAVVAALRKARPEMKILVLGVFPRRPTASDPVRSKIKDINERVAKLDDGKSVFYLDIGDRFLTKDGALTKEIMPDHLHLSPRGYDIWAEAIRPKLDKLLGK